MSGFDPRDPSWLRTYAGFQRAKRVFRSWRTKAEEAQLQRIEPLAKGISVYALFKWIGLTLRQDEGRQAYPFPFAAIQDYNSDSRHQEINSNYFISRIRRYASDQVCLPGKRLPLFVHGIAVLDAHVLVRCFRAWKAEYLRNRQLDDYYIVTYARRLFRLWIARSQAAKALRMRSARLALAASRAALRQIFLAWQHAQYLSRIVRQYIVPKRRLRTLDQFLQRVSRLKAQKCQQRLGFCHAITRRLARAFHVLASNRKATDQRIAFSQVKDGLKWHTRSHMMMGDAHTLAGSAAVGPYMQQLQVPSSKLRALSAWMCRLKGHDPSRSAQRALTAVGATAHTLRALLLAMRALAQHALHSRHIASAMSPWYPMQQKLRRGFRKWAADAQRRRRLRSAHHSVQASQRIRHLAELLSSWLLLTANRRVCQQVAHKVCCKRIQRQLVVSFHAWKDQYQRLALLKSNRKALLHQRDEELSRFRSLLAAKEVFGLQSSALRTWYLFSHEQKRARRFGSLWERMQRKCDLLRALDHWKVIASLSLIVTCWKKLWRGYRVRRLYYPAQYQYLLWYRKQVGRVLGFRRYSLQKRGMGILRTFHTHRLHRLLRYSISARCKHALRRWFAHFRQRRLHHRAQYNSSRYHMKVYAGMLLRRWQTRASWQRWQRSCYLSHYRAQLCAALRALHGHSRRARTARQAVCLRKHHALSRFRQRLSVSYSRTAAYLLNSAALWFVRKYFLFLLQHSQRMTKSSSMRRRRLRMRRRGYLLRWYEQAVIRCASRRQAARWHALRLLATSLHRLRGYRWEYFNRQARLPSGSASCRIVRGVVSSFLREKLRQLISHCADSRDRQRWHQHTCNRMRRRKMRLALQLLLHFAQKAKTKLKGKVHAAKVKSGRLKNLSYQHLMDSSKLRALLLDDGAVRAHGHRWISKWYSRVQQRDRFREHMRNLLTIRRQTILHQAIHRMLPYLRRQKRRRKQAKAQRAQYLMKRAHEAFQTLRRLVRHARRNRLLGLRAYKANRVVVCCAYLNKWRTLARFWKLTRGCRFVILKLKLKLRDFFRLLSQRARRRRSRRQHMANRMFTKRVVHWLRRLRRRGQHLLRSASILRLVHRNHCLTQMKQALLQWRYIAVMKKRFLRMSRRFHLLPALRAWHTAYLTSARHSSALRVMHRTVASRTRRSVFDAWRLFAVQAMRGKLQTTIVRAQAAHGTRERAFYAWINAISQRRLLERYHVLQQRTAHITRARCFLRWQRLHAWHDNLNAANLLAVWRNWRHCVRMYAKQRASLRLAKLFHVNRQVMSAWRVLLSRARRRSYYHAREELGRRRFLRKTYLRYFRTWKRQMYLAYYHHRGASRDRGRADRGAHRPVSPSPSVSPRKHHHLLLQQPLSSYRRPLLPHLWQPYRCFLHWHRVCVHSGHARRKRTKTRFFSAWRSATHAYKFKKQAFLQQLQAFALRSRLLLIWTPLHKHYLGGANSKLLARRRSGKTLLTAFAIWREAFGSLLRVRQSLQRLLDCVYSRQRRRMFVTWRLLGHRQRIDRLWLLRTALLRRWRKLFLVCLYRRLLTCTKVFQLWRLRTESGAAVCRLWAHRRARLADVLHKHSARCHALLLAAFKGWAAGRGEGLRWAQLAGSQAGRVLLFNDSHLPIAAALHRRCMEEVEARPSRSRQQRPATARRSLRQAIHEVLGAADGQDAAAGHSRTMHLQDIL